MRIIANHVRCCVKCRVGSLERNCWFCGREYGEDYPIPETLAGGPRYVVRVA